MLKGNFAVQIGRQRRARPPPLQHDEAHLIGELSPDHPHQQNQMLEAGPANAGLEVEEEEEMEVSDTDEATDVELERPTHPFYEALLQPVLEPSQEDRLVDQAAPAIGQVLSHLLKA